VRTFIIKARKGTTRWELVRSQIGSRAHFEVIAHAVINAFFISNGFRDDVEVYIVLDSSEDFPRTIKLSSSAGLSLAGFHEAAVLDVIETALKDSQGLQKNTTMDVAPGVQISGFGLEKLVGSLLGDDSLENRPVYLLEPKGEDIRTMLLEDQPINPVFILSDHLALPKKSVKGFKRHGLKTISLGKKMLFAAQCVVLLNYELDRLLY